MDYIVKGRFIARTEHDITKEVKLPANEELVKSLLSPRESPYLATIEVYGVQHEVKITQIDTEASYPTEKFAIRGYTQNADTKKDGMPVYINNYNWFYIAR